jgi:hypothetical protein
MAYAASNASSGADASATNLDGWELLLVLTVAGSR